MYCDSGSVTGWEEVAGVASVSWRAVRLKLARASRGAGWSVAETKEAEEEEEADEEDEGEEEEGVGGSRE